MVSDTETKPEVVKPGEPRGVLPAGTLLRTYELLSVLGQGSFGITYRARDTQLDRDVAIKEYLPTSLALREAGPLVMPRSTEHAEEFVWGRERFLDEARTLAKLGDAPSIVRVFDFLQDNGTAYMVMALASGETLEQYLKRDGHLSPARVDRLLQPLLDGLESIHAIGFLHRDIKPANILLDKKGVPTLIDFGAARAAIAGRTTAMTAIFTPGYAAAEQMTSAKQGPWTDIYGLSATLYHAITGKAPPSAFDRMLDDEYEPLARIAPPGFAPGLIAGIDAGLAVRASDRPQSIAGLRTVLSMASPADGAATIVSRTPTIQPARPTVSPAPATPPPAADIATTPTPPAKSRTPLYVGIAAAVLLLAGGGGWLALSSSKPAPPSAPGQATALQDMKVEDLERALAERRTADAAAAEKKRLEEEARRKAEADATSKLAADAELVKAEGARKQAEEELAKLKAEIEARRQDDTQAQALARRAEAETAQRKAEAEMAALRQAEDDARRKAAAEAKAKHEADEALTKAQAERQKADEEARRTAAAETKERSEASTKQIAEAEAKAKAEADAKTTADAEAKAKVDAAAAADKKAAESAETVLRLALPDRQRIQVALTSLGFDTRGSDGAFGPRSREMIGAWQKARNQPVTGFLTGPQQQALLKEAAPAIGKYNDEQKKIEDEKKTEEAKAKAAATAPTSSALSAPPVQPADDNKMLEQKSVTVYKKSGLQGACGSNFNYNIRVYRNMIQVNLGGAWRTARADAQGRFDSGEFKSNNSPSSFRITGTLSPRVINVENLTLFCAWQATF